MPDITHRQDINQLVAAFYTKAITYPIIGSQPSSSKPCRFRMSQPQLVFRKSSTCLIGPIIDLLEVGHVARSNDVEASLHSVLLMNLGDAVEQFPEDIVET